MTSSTASNANESGAAEIPIYQSSWASVRYHTETSLMHTLATTFDGDVIHDGVMFDIRSSPTSSVTIESLSFITSEEKPCDVEVFTKEGSYQYFEETRSAWIMIVNDSIQCLGPDVETILTKKMFTGMTNIEIERGSKRAFYIRLNGADLVYSEVESVNEVYREDSHIQILTGAGLGGFFQDFVAPRMWNGRVGYAAETNSFHNFADDVCSRFIQSDSVESTNNNFGLVFDLRSKAAGDLNVKGLAIFTDTNKDVEYEIYAIPNGYEFGLGSMTNWLSPVARGRGRSDGSEPLVISGLDFEEVKIAPGKTVGFYLTLKSKNLLYHVTSLSPGSTFVQNDDIVVTVGSGVASYPQKDLFYNSRGIYGQIYYTSNDACDLETTVSYFFVVHHPTFMTSKEVTDDIRFRLKATIPSLLKEDGSILKGIKGTHNLGAESVQPYVDNGDLGPCTSSKKDFGCIRITAHVTLSHEDGADPGMIEFGLLQNIEKVTTNMNLGDLDVYYSGNEPLGTEVMLTISGVPKKIMDMAEVEFLERSTKKYLKNNAESNDVEILSVEVKRQVLATDFEKEVNNEDRFLKEETTTIGITTVITGKHRPPSPGLDFDELVEDSINADDGAFKEELTKDITESGAEYFSSIEDVRASAAYTQAPTESPGKDLGYAKVNLNEKGLGVIATLLIIIGAAVFTFAIVFGTFILRKRRQEKKKFKLSKMDMDEDDEDDPLFFDIFKSRKNLQKDQSQKSPPKHAFIRKEIDDNDEEDGNPSRYTTISSLENSNSFAARHRVSTQQVVVDINGDNYNAVDMPDPSSGQKNNSKRQKRTSSSKSVSSRVHGPDSQYDVRSSATSSTHNSRRNRNQWGSVRSNTDCSSTSNQSSTSRPEFQKFNEANGYDPPARRKKSGSLMDIDLDNDIQGGQMSSSRRNIFDRLSEDNSSVMSSSTSSTLSSADVPGKSSRRSLSSRN